VTTLRPRKRVGRPRVAVPTDLVAELRRDGLSWRQIARSLSLGVGTIRRAHQAAERSTDACQNSAKGLG
jgi:DNA invertase Pin-like site-specific DNA recombinase